MEPPVEVEVEGAPPPLTLPPLRALPRSGFGLGMHVFIEMVHVVTEGFKAGGAAATPSAMLTDAARRILLTRGHFRRKERMPWMFPVVATFHIICTTGFLLWPLLCASRRWDGWWLALAACISLHWLFLCGECLLGWLEKTLLYEQYGLGDEPMHMWIMDVLPGRVAMALVLVFALACGVASFVMFWRCVRVTPSTVDVRVDFAGVGVVQAAMRWGWTPESRVCLA